MANVSMKVGLSAALAIAVGLAAGSARAEVIELLDKTKMTGKVVHY
jgi:hypothetical protein